MTSVPARRTRVLVVDDDPVMRGLLCALLATEAESVKAVESGEAGLAMLRAGYFADVLLVDIQLPGLTGAALAAQLRSALPHASLLGMSGSQPPAIDRQAFDAFLLKPFSLDEFGSAVRSAAGAQPKAWSQEPVSAELANALPDTPIALSDQTYSRLAAAIPAAQLAELYQLTLNDIADRLPRLRAALSAQDIEAYRREAHALKGGCSMVGASELTRLATLAEAGSLADTPAPEEFVAAVERLRSIIAEHSMLHL